jgi:hypothetical protein
MYSYKEVEEIKTNWKQSIMYHQLLVAGLMGIIVYLLGVIIIN